MENTQPQYPHVSQKEWSLVCDLHYTSVHNPHPQLYLQEREHSREELSTDEKPVFILTRKYHLNKNKK